MSERPPDGPQPDHEQPSLDRLIPAQGRRTQSCEHGPRPSPRICVASTADAARGILHGAWLDATQPADRLRQQVHSMLAFSPTVGATTWELFDYDGFAGILLQSSDSLETMSTLARGVARYGPPWAQWARLVDRNEQRLARFEAAFIGSYASRNQYSQYVLEASGLIERIHAGVPSWLQGYLQIDLESIAADLQAGAQISIVDQPAGEGVWVFDLSV